MTRSGKAIAKLLALLLIFSVFFSGISPAFAGNMASNGIANPTSSSQKMAAAAAISLQIIQLKEDLSVPLKPFIYVGESEDLDVLLDGVPQGGSDTAGFVWSSSDSSVADITGVMGGVVAKSKGTVRITVTYVPDGTTASISLQIKQPCTSLSVSDAAMFQGGTAALSVTINPSTTNDKAKGCTYKSSNPAVAAITAGGSIKAIKAGATTLTATFTNANCLDPTALYAGATPVPATVSASGTLTVIVPVAKVTLSSIAITIPLKGKYQLKQPGISPPAASSYTVSYSSANTGKAAVSGKGLITAGSKAATVYVSAKATHQKPTLGATSAAQSAKTLVSIYKPVSPFAGITKKANVIKYVAAVVPSSKTYSELNKTAYKKTIKTKGTKISVLGTSGIFFYVHTSLGYGFIKKSDVIYFTMSPTRRTIYRYTKTYPTVTVKIHNATSVTWSNLNKIAKYSVKKKSKVVKNKNSGETVTTIVYKIAPQKEGAVNTKASIGKLSQLCFLSIYSPMGNMQGFTKATIPMRRIASASTYGEKHSAYGNIYKNTGVTVIGKCKGWWWVKQTKGKGQKFWVDSSQIVYLTLSQYSMSMYRYHQKSFYAYLRNSNSYNKIQALSSDKKVATATTTAAKGVERHFICTCFCQISITGFLGGLPPPNPWKPC